MQAKNVAIKGRDYIFSKSVSNYSCVSYYEHSQFNRMSALLLSAEMMKATT